MKEIYRRRISIHATLQKCWRWMYLMLLISIVILYGIATGEFLELHCDPWLLGIVIIFVSVVYVNWVYWSARIIQLMLERYHLDIIILSTIVDDMEEIRKRIGELRPLHSLQKNKRGD